MLNELKTIVVPYVVKTDGANEEFRFGMRDSHEARRDKAAVGMIK
jgi:hypothetical protein